MTTTKTVLCSLRGVIPKKISNKLKYHIDSLNFHLSSSRMWAHVRSPGKQATLDRTSLIKAAIVVPVCPAMTSWYLGDTMQAQADLLSVLMLTLEYWTGTGFGNSSLCKSPDQLSRLKENLTIAFCKQRNKAVSTVQCVQFNFSEWCHLNSCKSDFSGVSVTRTEHYFLLTVIIRSMWGYRSANLQACLASCRKRLFPAERPAASTLCSSGREAG